MSDTRLDKLVTLGTNAARLAFVPNPPTGVLVEFYATDTNALWVWDGTWHLVASGGGGTGDVVGPASAVTAQIATYSGTTGKLIQDGGKTIAAVVTDATAAAKTAMPVDIAIVIDGGGAVITAGVKTDFRVSYAHTITAAILLADVSGSIVVDVWRDTLAAYPPTVGDSITAGTPPTLSGALTSTNALTSWLVTGAAGSTYRINVNAPSTTLTRVTLMLTITRT